MKTSLLFFFQSSLFVKTMPIVIELGLKTGTRYKEYKNLRRGEQTFYTYSIGGGRRDKYFIHDGAYKGWC